MHIYMTAMSAPCYFSEEELARLTTALPGYTVTWSKKRYRVSRSVASIEQVALLWGAEIFDLRFDARGRRKVASPRDISCPEAISVRFEGVTCASVCDATQGELHKVIMGNPDDPDHTRLLAFSLHVDIPHKVIDVGIDDWGRLTPKNQDIFLRLLRICEREFSTERNRVYFQSRKYVANARRRYILWLDREKKIAHGLTPHWTDRKGNGETVGKLLGAATTWQHVVECERALQAL